MYSNEILTQNAVNYRVTNTFPIDFLECIYSTASETISSPLNPSTEPLSVFAINDPSSSLEKSLQNKCFVV